MITNNRLEEIRGSISRTEDVTIQAIIKELLIEVDRLRLLEDGLRTEMLKFASSSDDLAAGNSVLDVSLRWISGAIKGAESTGAALIDEHQRAEALEQVLKKTRGTK